MDYGRAVRDLQATMRDLQRELAGIHRTLDGLHRDTVDLRRSTDGMRSAIAGIKEYERKLEEHLTSEGKVVTHLVDTSTKNTAALVGQELRIGHVETVVDGLRSGATRNRFGS